ncbi:MAG: hypothetical protein JSV91_13835 [Phycisphaerales bacterium]|nr:MAG: hypothetical protein JSV91_13835 [Phycisphaerales bacterium]
MSHPIRRTECMTFPRSGHHLLQGLLSRYFCEQDFVYCEMYTDPEHVLDLDDQTNFQKNHDLELTTPIRDDRQYLVQIRYPIESIVSWYRSNCDKNQVADSPGAWTNFAIERVAFWMCFYRKWVLDYVPDRLIVNYADLVEHSTVTLEAVVRFLGDEQPDPERIEECCKAAEIGRKNYFPAFKYYGSGFFGLLRKLFSAVPGIDIVNDELIVPGGMVGPGASEQGPREVVMDLRRAGEHLLALAERLSEIQSADAASGQWVMRHSRQTTDLSLQSEASVH